MDWNFEKTRELKDIETNEISLVDNPANRKKFLFYKSGKQMDNRITQLFSAFADNNMLDADELVEVQKSLEVIDGVSDKQLAAFENLMAILGVNVDIAKSEPAHWPTISGVQPVAKDDDEDDNDDDDDDGVAKSDQNWPSLNVA